MYTKRWCLSQEATEPSGRFVGSTQTRKVLPHAESLRQPRTSVKHVPEIHVATWSSCAAYVHCARSSAAGQGCLRGAKLCTSMSSHHRHSTQNNHSRSCHLGLSIGISTFEGDESAYSHITCRSSFSSLRLCPHLRSADCTQTAACRKCQSWSTSSMSICDQMAAPRHRCRFDRSAASRRTEAVTAECAPSMRSVHLITNCSKWSREGRYSRSDRRRSHATVSQRAHQPDSPPVKSRTTL